MPPPHRTSEELLRHLVQPICLVGNATSQYRLGTRIDSYPTVIRMNNYRIAGFEPQVGSCTTLRAVTGWSDVENRGEHTEFTPFTASARESAHLEAYNSRNHTPVLTAALDVHPLIPELAKPSLGFALVQLMHSLAIPVDLFNFDGFRSAHYWDPTSGLRTTHSQGELDLLLARGNVVLFNETFDYAPLYDFCHTEHPEYNDNVGFHLARQLALSPSGERILEFGAGNGALAHHFEGLGNAVTAIEVSGRACAGISCNQVIQGSALSLVTLEGKYDRFVSIDVLEHLTENDARIVAREAARLARRLFVTVSTRPSGLRGPQGEDLHLCLRPPEWWEALFAGEFDLQIRPGPHDRQYILEGVSRRAPQSHPVITTRTMPSDRYFIKEGYQSRHEAQYFEDHVSAETGIIWQPDVYAFVATLAQAAGSTGVVDLGCGRAEKLLGLRGTFQTLGIDIGSNIAYCKRTFPEGMWLEWDLERDELPPVPPAFLHESLIVCSDLIEHLRNPRPLLRHLRALLGEAAFAVVTTPERDLTRGSTDYGPPANPAHVREWNRDELVQLLVSEGLTIDFVGTTSSNSQENVNATTIIVLGSSRLDAAERLKRLGQAALEVRDTTQQALTGSLRRLLLSVSSRRLLGEDLLTLLRRVPAAPSVEATVNEHLKVAYGEIQDLAHRGDLHRASAMLRAFLDRHPECALGHNDLGVLSYALGEPLTAKACYERAIDLDPAVLSFRKNLADLKFAAFREVGESLALYGAVLQSAPTDVEALQNTALIFNAIGKTDEACAIAHRLRSLDEHNAIAQALCPGLPCEILERLPRETTSRGRSSRAAGYSFCIITNGKRPQKLLSELESIRSQKLSEYEIVLGGEIPEWLDTTGVRVLPMPEAARAGRLGEMRNLLCREARYATLIVADDDMVFHEGFIEALERFGDSFDALAVRIINPDGTRFWDWASAGGAMGHRLLEYGQHDPRVYITGGLIVLRAEVIEHVAWDGTRGLYQDEDVDFSDRLREAGFSIQFCAGAVATHDDPSYTQKGKVVVRTDAVEDETPEDRLRMPVYWAAPFFNPSGYASEAISFVVPLAEKCDLQIKHDNNLTSETFLQGLPQNTRQTLQRLERAGYPEAPYLAVSHNPANGFKRFPGAAYCIGRTMFETDRIPQEWVAQCALMDEVWVPSAFNLETFARSGVPREKLVKIPGAIDTTLFDPGCTEPIELPNRCAFNFLSVFEWTERKGWDVLLRAYFEEFTASDDVCLYLRTYLLARPDISQKEEILRRIAAFARSLKMDPEKLPAVEVLDEQLPTLELPSLYRACDAFVSASRGEGWGRPLMEAMAMGLPTIATDWSGNTEFMTRETSYLLPIEGLSTIEKMQIPIYVGHRWAEPSVKHLRRLMRRVASDTKDARARGRRARNHIVRHFSQEAVARLVHERLQRIEAAHWQRSAVRLGPDKQRVAHLLWEGDQFSNHSLAIVNRALCSRLVGTEEEPVLRAPDAGHEAEAPSCARLREHLAGEPLEAELTVRHAWPPDFTPPATGHWVMMQPWEFGPLPKRWAEVFATQLDDVWVYSRHLRDHYIRSGVPPERVGLIPLGVETSGQAASPFPLQTEKSVRFLFVGGTIARKGIDILLDAYTSSFNAEDDVCLVIKDFGTDSFYKGQTARQRILELQTHPGAPAIEYIERTLSEDEIRGLYVSCTALVHPYRAEGFGLPIVEAMAEGLPVIVTGAGAALDYLNDDRAFLIPSRTVRLKERSLDGLETVDFPLVAEPDPQALAALMHQVAEDPSSARARGAAGRNFIRHNFSWERSAEAVRERLRLVRSRPIRRFFGEAEGTAQLQVREHFTSVIVMGEAPERAVTLDALQDLGSEDHEIILVADEPAEGARIRVGTFAEAVACACGDAIVVLRSGVQPGEGWIAGLRRALFARPGYGLAAPLEEWCTTPLEPEELLRRAQVLAHGRTLRRVRPLEVGESCVMVTREVAVAATREAGTGARAAMRGLWIQSLARGLRCVLAADTLVVCPGPQPRALSIGQLLAQRMQESPDEELILPWGHFRVLQALQRGDMEGALDIQRAMLKRFPQERSLVRQMIWLLLRAGWVSEAAEMLQGCSGEEREDAEWLKLEGFCALAQGALDRADRCAAQVLEKQPLSCRALLLRGMVATSRGEGAAAERSFRAAQVADPSRGLPHTHLGSLLWARNEQAQALEELERGFVLSPDEPEVAATYTDAASQLDAEERASELVEEASELYPEVRHLHQLKASFLLVAEKQEAARMTLLEMMARFGVEDDLLNAAIELSKDGVKEEPVQGQNPPRLSLCMIVRDEQEHLARALWSALPLADEIVLVDTGSSDRSVDLAMAFGCRVIRHAWNDSFASARNAGISAARGSWVLVLDADEELAVADHQALRELVASRARRRAYRMLTRNYVATADVTGFRHNDGTYREEAGAGWIPSLKVRLFPRDPRVRFEGAVHELVEPSLERAGLRVDDAPVVIHHYGKLDRHRTQRKGQLYRVLGQEKLLSESASPEAIRELAVQEEELGNFADALTHWRRYLERVPEDLQALLGIGRSAIGAGETAAALEALERARELDGRRPELRIQLVIAMLHAGRGGEALAGARALAREHPQLHHARAVLALALLAGGAREEALTTIRSLQEKNVSLEKFLTGHARRFLTFGPKELAVALLEPLADAGMISAEQATILVEAYRAQSMLA